MARRAQALGMNLGSGRLTAESFLIFQSLVFLVCKIKSGCSLCRDEIYQRYVKYPTQSRHSANASSPFLFRGILSVSWSQVDAELLLSSAKDNQVLCWNLGSSEVGWHLCGRAGWEVGGGGNPVTPVCSGWFLCVRASLTVCFFGLGGVQAARTEQLVL